MNDHMKCRTTQEHKGCMWYLPLLTIPWRKHGLLIQVRSHTGLSHKDNSSLEKQELRFQTSLSYSSKNALFIGFGVLQYQKENPRCLNKPRIKF